jgi:hypothetical protein
MGMEFRMAIEELAKKRSPGTLNLRNQNKWRSHRMHIVVSEMN